MKVQLAINFERMDGSMDTRGVAGHTLEMVQRAEAGGFNIAWAARKPFRPFGERPKLKKICNWPPRIRLAAGPPGRSGVMPQLRNKQRRENNSHDTPLLTRPRQ
jgi:hypothetical protein